MLSTFVGNNEYEFSTSDVVKDNKNIKVGVKYDFELEGYWSFIYFCYKRMEKDSRAIGYVYFSNLNIVRRVEI